MASVLAVPVRLKLATTAFLLCVPLAAIETVLVSRAPWWKLPYDKIALWSAAIGLMSAPLAGWILQGRRWAFHFAVALSALWCVLSAWVAFRTKDPGLGFFSLLLVLFFVAVLSWIRYEIDRTFFDPMLSWYEGAPRPIPGVTCELALGDHREEFRVSRLDRHGAFVYQAQSLSPKNIEAILSAATRSGKRPELEFRFRDQRAKAFGMPVRLLDRGGRGFGAGFQFKGMSSDMRKELGDLVESLKGEGYV